MAHDDTTPFLDEPPQSPWRIRMHDSHRRSRMFKRIVTYAALLAVMIPFTLLFSYFRHSSASPSEDVTVILDVNAAKQPPSSLNHASPFNISEHAVQLSGSPIAEVEPIVFSLIMFSHDSASEGAILMKSILMYSSRPVEFHIICDEVARTYLEHRLSLLKRPRQNTVVKFYDMPISTLRARIAREGAIASDHSAGSPGLLKLFIHEVLPETVKKAIFVDTDAFFISDPLMLWQQFESFGDQVAVSLPTHSDQNEDEWHYASNICSCVMLLDLEKLRNLRLMDSKFYREQDLPALSPPAFTAMYGPPGPDGHYVDVKLGDQGYWWAIVSHRPEILRHLSYDWEVSSCLVSMYGTSLGQDDATDSDELSHQIHTVNTAEEGHVVTPKLVHFNCLNTERYHEWDGWSNPNDELGRAWGPAVKYHAGTKWIWLNHQPHLYHLNTSVSIETIYNIKFLDELTA